MPVSIPQQRPNIVLILADDLGFSDLGCYGSEIRTPNIDALASRGLRFTQMYNSARCCPSRAALLTGVNPHQAGIGHMTENLGTPSYQGYLNESCATVAQVLKGAGYKTLMSGKWHVGGNPTPSGLWSTKTGQPVMPQQRGFDQFWGMLIGGGSYFNPGSMMDGDTPFDVGTADFYLTDAITDHAVEMVDGAVSGEDPFFLYVAYTAPHWPLHALEEDIARYEGNYRYGWDVLRKNRHEEMKGLGLVDPRWEISPRDDDAPPWERTADKEWEAMRMAVYAAQIDRMDQGVGRIIERIEQAGEIDNTLIVFLADNGGCAEFLHEDAFADNRDLYCMPPVDGGPFRVGNIPGLLPGSASTYMSYDIPWANVSNAPFRLFKRWVHEGGVSTPFVLSWPEVVKKSEVVSEPSHIVDIAATFIDVANAIYPRELNNVAITPLEGESFLSVLQQSAWSREKSIVWEHEGNRALRNGPWKIVSEYPGDWELYNIDEDRTELNNLAAGDRARVEKMSSEYDQWAERCGVLPWEIIGRDVPMHSIGRHNHTSGWDPDG